MSNPQEPIRATLYGSSFSRFPWLVTRYFLRRIFTFAAVIQAVGVGVYVIIDWFERVPYVVKNNVSATTMLAYYGLKLPLIVSQTAPPSIGAALVIALALANRSGEVLALRASGFGPSALFGPLIITMSGFSICLLVWNETLVPPTASRAQQINLTQIKLRDRRTFLAEQEVWLRGRLGFYHVSMVDRKNHALRGLTIYQLDQNFQLRNALWFPVVEWTGDRWRPTKGSRLPRTGSPGTSPDPLLDEHAVAISLEPFPDFLELQRETEELSFTELNSQIRRLRSRGLDASHLLPELHAKLAIPFVPLVLTLTLVPLATANRWRKHTYTTLLAAMVLGFLYWVLLLFMQSLPTGTGAAAVFFAWLPNSAFALLGLVLSLRLR